MARELTGRKVFAITASAFAVIIAVNIVLAVQAVRTFPGLEVPNSYVASQTFDSDLAAQRALGWKLTHGYEGGVLRLSFRDAKGQPVEVQSLQTTLGRTTEAADDLSPGFRFDGSDYTAAVPLRPGKWMILLEAHAKDGTRFHQRLDLFVKG